MNEAAVAAAMVWWPHLDLEAQRAYQIRLEQNVLSLTKRTSRSEQAAGGRVRSVRRQAQAAQAIVK
jgi:hypothetical protein